MTFLQNAIGLIPELAAIKKLIDMELAQGRPQPSFINYSQLLLNAAQQLDIAAQKHHRGNKPNPRQIHFAGLGIDSDSDSDYSTASEHDDDDDATGCEANAAARNPKARLSDHIWNKMATKDRKAWIMLPEAT